MPLGAWPIVVVLVDDANIVLFCVSCIMNDSVLGLFNTVSGQNKTVGGFGQSGSTPCGVGGEGRNPVAASENPIATTGFPIAALGISVGEVMSSCPMVEKNEGRPPHGDRPSTIHSL